MTASIKAAWQEMSHKPQKIVYIKDARVETYPAKGMSEKPLLTLTELTANSTRGADHLCFEFGKCILFT